jgi:hypothetical protein
VAEPEAGAPVERVEGEHEEDVQALPAVQRVDDRRTALPLAAPRSPSTGMPVLPKAPIQRSVADEVQSELPLEAPRLAPRPAEDRGAAAMTVTRRPMAAVQRAPETSSASRPESSAPRLPLAPNPARVAERVQREETSTASPSVESTFAKSQTEEVPAKAPSLNLYDLARRIYPILKRMLAIERERR